MNKLQLLLETLEEWDGGAPRVVPIPNSSTLEATFDIHFEEVSHLEHLSTFPIHCVPGDSIRSPKPVGFHTT